MPTLRLMQTTARADAWPDICALSGDTAAVTAREINVPMAQGGAIRLHLPLTERSYRRCHAVRRIHAIAVTVAWLSPVAGMTVSAASHSVAGVMVYLAACALPLLTRYALIDGYLPRVEASRDGALILFLPHAAAAEKLQRAADLTEALLHFAQRRPQIPSAPSAPSATEAPALPQP